MIVQLDKFISDVRVVLEENRKEHHLLLTRDEDTLSLDDLIIKSICPAVQVIEQEAPLEFLDPGYQIDASSIAWEKDGCGWIILPEDFMRLMCFKMSSWRRPVYEAIGIEDPIYLRQFSRFKGLRGTPERPVVAVLTKAEGKILEFFSCLSEDDIMTQGVYRAFPSFDENSGIDVSKRCYDASIYMVAGLTLLNMGAEHGQDLIQMARLSISKNTSSTPNVQTQTQTQQ